MARSEEGPPPFTDDELAEGMRLVRKKAAYADLVPPPGALKMDWFTLRAIGIEVNKRRPKEGRYLAKLTGTVVREFVPAVSPGTRRLGKAYRDTLLDLFRRRKSFQTTRRQRKASAGDTIERGQPRLL